MTFLQKRHLLLFALGALGVQTITLAADFTPPKPYKVKTLYKEVVKACPKKDWTCVEEKLLSFTMTHGPQASVDTFEYMKARGEIDLAIDPHHFVHHAGHHTAMAFGTSAKALALCPTVYHYGCYHGFFQHALGMNATSEINATKICADLEKDASVLPETQFSCYHGLGHGLMMYEKWDLKKALPVCDAIPSPSGRDGCWQGVFMENINKATEGQWELGGFSKTDPLAPCDTLAPQYQYQCFINHNGWLMRFYQMDITKATQACLKAPKDQVFTCLSSIGLSISNSSWQVGYMRNEGNKADVAGNTWTLCQKFPEGHLDACVLPSVDNLMLTNNMDTMTSQGVCVLVKDPALQTACFKQIGLDLRRITNSYPKAQAGCAALNSSGRDACLEGAGKP